MPGIAGIISRSRSPECQSIVEAMIDTMRHEPFYHSGTCFAPELGVFGAWLAHPNSFALAQSENGSNTAVGLAFSGECFGDSAKASASGNPEENWIVSDYEQQGARFVESLNGLFSGLLVDRKQKRAFLFNDRFGIERIYYHQAKDAFYFASEAKALLRVLPELREFDPAGVVQHLAFGCTHGSQTLFRGISLLAEGSLLTFEPGEAPQTRRYFTPERWESQTLLGEKEFQSEFSSTFNRVLPRYIKGGSLGISLTGGLDTRMIMACLPEEGPTPVCYTFAGKSKQLLDARLAAQIAALRGLQHEAIRIDERFFAEFSRNVDRTVWISDGLAGATGSHEIFFNSAARLLAPIRLTGNFGSEVLRAVSTFKPLGLVSGLLEPALSRRVIDAASRLLHTAAHPVTFSAFREIPFNIFGTPAVGRSQLTLRTPYLDNEIVSLAYRTPTHLRTSPTPALKLIQQMSPALAAIPTDRGISAVSSGAMNLLRHGLSQIDFKLDYLQNEGWPKPLSAIGPVLESIGHLGLLGRHKFLGYRGWFRKELLSHVTSVLTDSRLRSSPLWRPGAVEQILTQHSRGQTNYVREINAILTFDAIERQLLSSSGYKSCPPATQQGETSFKAIAT